MLQPVVFGTSSCTLKSGYSLLTQFILQSMYGFVSLSHMTKVALSASHTTTMASCLPVTYLQWLNFNQSHDYSGLISTSHMTKVASCISITWLQWLHVCQSHDYSGFMSTRHMTTDSGCNWHYLHNLNPHKRFTTFNWENKIYLRNFTKNLEGTF